MIGLGNYARNMAGVADGHYFRGLISVVGGESQILN